jgi:iron complex outermembrane recepter protein
MLTNSIRRTLLATTIIAGSLGVTPSFAQTAPAVEEEATGSTIVVTGSRVARPNTESPSPITTVGAEDVKEFGATKIEDLSNSLPQVFAGQSSGVSNGADGTATVNLRGLGSNRTVVLIDGKRLQPGSIGGNSAADLNFIPSALISSVDLLTGGASAAYGADAVAGVVNFKMNRKFKGLRLDAQYGFYQHTNNNPIKDVVNLRFVAPEGNVVTGGAYDATMALGSGFDEDRGSFVVYAGYRSESAITQDKYDTSICTLNPSGNAAGLACGGSGTPERTRFGGFTNANAILAGIPDANPNLAGYQQPGSYSLTTTNTLRGFVTSDQYNFAPLNYFRRPSERYNLGAFAEYELSPALKPYLDVMFNDYSTKAQIAPSGAFYGPRTVNCDNPFLAANPTLATATCGANVGVAGTTSTILIGKRNVEGGPRFNDIGFNQFRIVTGLKGDLNEAFSYDAYFQTGTIKFANVYRNDVSSARIDEALLATGTVANAVCTSGNPACVPYNVFNNNGVTQAAAAYIGIPLVITGSSRETIVAGSLQANLGTYGIQSPFSDDGIRASVGAEYRTEALATQPDLSYINGDGAGQGGPTLPIDGFYKVTDLFGELGIPIVTDKPFFHDLSIELGYRHSKYNVRGATKQNSTDTYKIAGNWSPIPDLTLRGSYNRAVRSPNIGELFTNQSVGLFAGSDPCAGTATAGLVNGFTAAQCARTGVTAAQFGNITPNTAQQYNFLGGGNLNLNPEKSDSFSYGVVLQPKGGFLRGLVLSADYFNIKVKDAVGGIGAQVILNQCIATNDPFFCGKITRAPAAAGPAAGSLWLDESGFVDDRTTNTGSLKTSGIDINGDYRTTLGENKIRWQFVGTWVDKLVIQPLTNGFEYDCAGYYGITCGNPNPEFRFNTNVKFTTADDFGLTVRWRYYSSVKVDTLSPDVDLNGGTPNSPTPADDKIAAYSYFDLLFSLPIKDTATFRIGVNNIFDKDPPIISQGSLGGFGNGNTFPGTYDQLGRYVFVNLTADF